MRWFIMAVVATLPLSVIVGSNGQPFAAGNDFWDETFTHPRWYDANTYNEEFFSGGPGFDTEVLSDGSLYLTIPDTAAQSDYFIAEWQNRNNTSSPLQAYDYPGWDLYDAEIYFKVIPPTDAGSFFNQLIEFSIEPVGYVASKAAHIQWYGFGNGDTPYIYMAVRGADGTTVSVDIPYVATDHRWVKWKHDAAADTYTIYTSGNGGEPWTQQVQTTAAPISGVSPSFYTQYWDLTNSWVNFLVTAEVVPASFDRANFDQYIGAWNYIPRSFDLPLNVKVGDPLVSTLTKTLPLAVEVGDPSGV